MAGHGRVHALHADAAAGFEPQRLRSAGVDDADVRAGVENEIQWPGGLWNLHLHPQQTFAVFKRDGVCRRQ